MRGRERVGVSRQGVVEAARLEAVINSVTLGPLSVTRRNIHFPQSPQKSHVKYKNHANEAIGGQHLEYKFLLPY
jgi:hypothetical protein